MYIPFSPHIRLRAWLKKCCAGLTGICGYSRLLSRFYNIYIYYDTQQIFFLETWFGIEYHHDMLLYDIVCSFWGPVCGGL